MTYYTYQHKKIQLWITIYRKRYPHKMAKFFTELNILRQSAGGSTKL